MTQEARVPRPRRHGLSDGRPPRPRRAPTSPSTTAPPAKAAQWVAQHGGRSRARRRPTRPRGAEICDDVRRQRRRRPRGRVGADGALAGDAAGTMLVDHTTASAEVAREMHAAAASRGRRLPRRAGLGRPGRRRERQAHDHGRRRRATLRARRGRARPLRARGDADGRPRAAASSPRWSTRSASPGWCRRSPRASTSPTQRGPRRRARARRHQQGRRAVVADGEPRQDDGRRQVRLRLRRRLDAQGPRHLPRRGARQRRARCRSPRWSTSSTRACRRRAAGAGTRRA